MSYFEALQMPEETQSLWDVVCAILKLYILHIVFVLGHGYIWLCAVRTLYSLIESSFLAVL